MVLQQELESSLAFGGEAVAWASTEMAPELFFSHS